MIVHDWLIEFATTGPGTPHRGLCRGCGRTTYAAGYLDNIDVGGECSRVESSHDWIFGISGRAYAACGLCGVIRSAVPFDGQTRYGPLDLSGDCPVLAAVAS